MRPWSFIQGDVTPVSAAQHPNLTNRLLGGIADAALPQTIVQRLSRLQGLLTVKEVAHILRMHPETVRVYARAGKIPAIKTGYRLKFDPGRIAEWVAQRQM